MQSLFDVGQQLPGNHDPVLADTVFYGGLEELPDVRLQAAEEMTVSLHLERSGHRVPFNNSKEIPKAPADGWWPWCPCLAQRKNSKNLCARE